jgi:hypothetical protein
MDLLVSLNGEEEGEKENEKRKREPPRASVKHV